MKQKDVTKLLKAYKELCDGEDKYPASMENYLTKEKSGYRKYMGTDHTTEFKIAFLIEGEGYNRKLSSLRLYEAFAKYDMKMLNNALYENARLAHLNNLGATDNDHTYFSYNVMPDLLAANMVDHIPLLLPEENGMCTGSVTGTAITNLFMSIWYQREDFAKEAIPFAKKKLSQKIRDYDHAYISYLLAILNKDVSEASIQLELMCKGHRKLKDWGITRFTRSFALGAHAMYNLSHYVYDGTLDGLIKMPETDNFCQDLAIWQREHDYKPGRIVTQYPEPIDLMNHIMQTEPPTMHLRRDAKGNTSLDRKRFEKELIAKIMSTL